jgi:hypothetical protein
MNSYITSQNPALGVVDLRNSRAITCDRRLDGNILSRNLLRPESISTSLGSADQLMNSYLTSQNIALGDVYLRNSRAHAPAKYAPGRLDGKILSRESTSPRVNQRFLRRTYKNFGSV